MKHYDATSNLCFSHTVPARDIPYLRPIHMKHHIIVPDVVFTYIVTGCPEGDTKYQIHGYTSFAPDSVFFPTMVRFMSGPINEDELDKIEEKIQEYTQEIISPDGLGYMRLFLSQFLHVEHGIVDDLPDYWSYRAKRTEEEN